MKKFEIKEHFQAIAIERGRDNNLLSTWTDDGTLNLFASGEVAEVSRLELAEVPSAFHLSEVLSEEECDTFVSITETLGYHTDSPVSLPYSFRHNMNLNWVVSEAVDSAIWNRCSDKVTEKLLGGAAVGLNARFRFYQYGENDFFKPHTDGAWPGSRVIDGELIDDAYGDRLSMMTFLLFLSDGFEGGRTEFYVPDTSLPPGEAMRKVQISTPKGSALCFPHGPHPDHCMHAGETVLSGKKYIIRSDILFPFAQR